MKIGGTEERGGGEGEERGRGRGGKEVGGGRERGRGKIKRGEWYTLAGIIETTT